MRTILITLLFALALTGCGFSDDSPAEPTEPAVAEETGVIVTLGNWITVQAARIASVTTWPSNRLTVRCA